MVDSNRITKRQTLGAILSTAGISIGAAYFSLGISLLYTIPPLIAEYSQKNATSFEYSIVTNYVQVAPYYMYGGLLLIGLSIGGAITTIYRDEIRLKIKKWLSTSRKVKVLSSSRKKKTIYTGNKYFHTRPRLAYHPPNKQFLDEKSFKAKSLNH